MVTVDIRDQPGLGRPGARELFGVRWSRTAVDPALRVRRRVVITDLATGLLAVAAATQVWSIELTGWAWLAPLLWPLSLMRAGAYDSKRFLLQGITPSTLISAASWAVVGIALAGVVFFTEVNVRESLRVTALLLGATLLGRALVARWVTNERRHGGLRVPVLVRGPATEIGHYVQMVAHDPAPAFDVLAVQQTDHGPLEDVGTAAMVTSLADPVTAAVNHGVAAIVLVGPTNMPSDVLRRTIWAGEQQGIDTLMLPIVEPVAHPQIAATQSGGPVSMVFRGPNRQLFGIKRLLDLVLAGLGLLILLPVMVGIGVVIRGTSSGPVLFRQARVGRDGQEFTMLKFRTMVEDAEDRRAELEVLNEHKGGTLFKVRDDPRITPIGRILRKCSADELPQLINVLRGEMSLVGPRPPLPEEVANYPADQRRRFAVNPGITGLWQVSGRSDLDPLRSARLDTQYVENWSFGLDLRILVKTVKVVVLGSGAY